MTLTISNIIPAIKENMNPEYFLLNLNPQTRSKSNEQDYTYTIVAWATALFGLAFLLLIITMVKKYV